MRLLELPDECTLDHILGERAELRAAGAEDTVVLATPEHSFQVRLVESTNSFMLISCSSNNKEITHAAKHTLELVRMLDL